MRDKLNKWIAEYSEFFEPNAHWAGYHNMRRDQGGYEVKAKEVCHHISYLAKSRRAPKSTFCQKSQRDEVIRFAPFKHPIQLGRTARSYFLFLFCKRNKLTRR